MGLPNKNNNQKISCINATIQLFTNLPEVNKELPLLPTTRVGTMFKDIVYGLQCSKQYSLISKNNQAPILIDFDVIIHEFQSKWLHDLHDCHHLHYSLIFRRFFTNCISKTKFNHRFQMKPFYDHDFYHDDHVSKPHGPSFTIDLSTIMVEKVNLIQIMNTLFGVPSLFYGSGLESGLESFKKSVPKLTQLPLFFVFLFHRFHPNGMINTTTVEITMEMDMGTFLQCFKKQDCTFYKLYGFVTQKDGMYMTYSRIQSRNNDWFRFKDDAVEKVDLGSCLIESKGIVLALYRLQDF